MYEYLRRSPIPLIAGGIVDQPYIVQLQYEVVDEQVTIMEILAAAAAPPK